MKLIKTSALALAMSAMLAGPVLAQGASSDPKLRGSVQDKGSMQKGVTGSGDEECNAQPGAPGERAGVGTKAKGTVGAGSGAKGTGGAAGDSAAGGKRY
jgi:hypothetical protein